MEATTKKGSASPINKILWCFILLSVFAACTAVKRKYASENECDRYSLDALYYEKYIPLMDNILADSTEFVTQVTSKSADSLISLMAALPGRDFSDSEERQIHTAFNEMKRQFQRATKKIKQNVTTTWNTLLASNFDMLLDRENSSLEKVRDDVVALAEACNNARKSLDSSMRIVISPIKGIVRDGLDSISMTAEIELNKHKNQTNTTNEENSKDQSDTSTSSTKADDAELYKIKRNITEEIVPGFLKNVTLIVLERKVNLSKEVDLKDENRESVLDDMCFSMLLMKNRIKAIVHKDSPPGKDARDLNRRSVYMHWVTLSTEMYEEKIRNKRSSKKKRRKDPKKIWEDENALADTLVTLMQNYQ